MSIRLLVIILVALLLSLVLGSGYWLNKVQTNKIVNELSHQELGMLTESIRNNIINQMRSGADMQALDKSYRAIQNQQPKILDLRVIHGASVARKFALHHDSESYDDVDRQGIASDSPIIAEQGKQGQEVLRFVYPLKAEAGCLKCHDAQLGEKLGAVSLTMDTSLVNATIREQQRSLIFLALGEGLILLSLLTFVINRLIFHPMLRLGSGAKQLKSGDFSHRVDGASGNEVGTLIHTFNDMATQIQMLMQNQDDLLREQAMDLARLVAMSQLLGSSFGETAVLNQFAKSLTDSAKVTWCRIAILDEDTGKLGVKAVYSMRDSTHEKQPMTDLPEKQYPKMWRLMHAKQSVVVQPQDELSTDESRLLFSNQETNVLCMPIINKDMVRGMVIFGEFRSQERDPLDDRKVYLCRAMVSQIGSAIEIRHLFSRFLEQSEETVLAMAEAVEKKSPWTAGHSKRVTRYALMIAKSLGWDEKRLEELRITGLLHDIGKIGMPGLILNKADKLTNEEYAIVKRHPEEGAQILSKMRLFRAYAPSVRHHHEWYNGKGYPDGLRGQEIPVNARILAVADAFDAMTADRPYHKGLSPEEAMNCLQQGAGEQFDAEFVEKFRLVYQS